MMKFKVGDKVKVKNTLEVRWVSPGYIGKTGRIAHVGSWWYDVKFKGRKGVWEAHEGELSKVRK
jgi:ribosomal protein L21E